MKASFKWFLLLAFAVTMGDFAFRTWFPSTTPEYSIGGEITPLTSPSGDEAKKHLYLRRSWYFSQSPERAWLQVMGQDFVEVWVNGQSVGRSQRTGYHHVAGLVTDITSYLHNGKNSIAIHALQTTLGELPAIAIDGQLEYPDGRQQTLADAVSWRANDLYEHHGSYWYETDFDDSKWATPKTGEPEYWRTQVNLPPRAVTEPRHSKWVNPASAEAGAAAFATNLNVNGAPREGWLRVVATGPYRVAVNGWLVADDQVDLAAEAPQEPMERTFDVSAFLKSGDNRVAIMVTTPGEPPRLRADVEATSVRGEVSYAGTDDTWKSIAGNATAWQTAEIANNDVWKACTPEIGYLRLQPRAMEREVGEIHPSLGFWGWRAVYDTALMIAFALAGLLGCKFIGSLLPRQHDLAASFNSLPYVALLPSAILAAAAALATWDYAWVGRDFYQPRWLAALAMLVAVQWLALLVIAAFVRSKTTAVEAEHPLRRRRALVVGGVILAWCVLFGVSTWLRFRDITAEPIHHDEVTCYAFTQAVRQYGFPGGQVDPEIPFGWCATSELTFYPTALVSFFTDDPCLVLRIPSVIFSLGTMALLAYMCWRWFNPQVAFLAAVLYGLSPHTVGSADFGRYFAQVQFFTLLTMYLTYEAVRGTGRPPLGLLWGAAVSFVAMYLSWEGTGFFGIGLALAVLFQRRRHLRPILSFPSFYFACAFVGLVVIAQNAHRIMQQTERLWYGEGINSLTVMPMWKFPFFDPVFFLVNTSWIRDALLPMIGLALACIIAIRHRWRFPLRFSLICLVVNAELMSLLLPLRTNRYSYHLVAITILICAAVVVAIAQLIVEYFRSVRLPSPYEWYVKATAAFGVVAFAFATCGWTFRTAEITNYVTSAYDVRQLRNPDWEGITDYLLAHMGEHDALVAIFPHEQNFVMAAKEGREEASHKVDYWLESKLIVQATLGDHRQIPLDRRSGAKMLYNLEQVQKLFSEYDRVWYCTMRFGHAKINEDVVSQYLRQHMDVVYEDFDTALLVRDRNSRPAIVQLDDEEAGELASDFYLR